MLENYLIYLDCMTSKIQKLFDEQKDYIYCHKGCSKCCKHAQFPYSEIEFRFLYKGLQSLNPEIQNQVLDNIDKRIIEKQAYNIKAPNQKFRYDCPFLINDECSVYYYRGLICRTFGLMSFTPNKEKTPKIPFCAYEGLNYSNFVTQKKDNLSSDVDFAENKHVLGPNAYNIDYDTLINEELAQEFGFKFGEVKPLIEWFILWKEQIIEKIKQ